MGQPTYGAWNFPGECPSRRKAHCNCFIFGEFPYQIVIFFSNCHLSHRINSPLFFNFLFLYSP